jgi:hypothetical protein
MVYDPQTPITRVYDNYTIMTIVVDGFYGLYFNQLL